MTNVFETSYMTVGWSDQGPKWV